MINIVSILSHDGGDGIKIIYETESGEKNNTVISADDFLSFGIVKGLVTEEEFKEIELAAENFHISPSSLRRAFISRLGVSPIQYLTELRMKRAVELLINSTLSIREISTECGYEDEKYFSRVFKKKYGYPPSAFSAK